MNPDPTNPPRHVGPNPRRSRSSRLGRGLSKALLALVQGTFIASTVLVAPVLAANPSANLDQCANDPAPSPASDGCNSTATQWVNGNLGASKSFYREGDSIPYRLTFGNLSTSGSHTVKIEWDTTKSSKHAIDYIDTYTQSVLNANACLGVTGCGSGLFSPASFAIPADPQVTGAGVTPIAGHFTFYGATIASVSAYTYSTGTGFVGDKSASLVITFNASVADPVLAWGGHIGTRLDWGLANSAVAISGSPYHTRLLDLDGSGGNQDRSLSAGAVFFPASITIVKQATPEGSTSFPFTGTPSPLTNFSLVDDGTSANTKLFSNILAEATYTVTETPVPSGWAFDSITCSVTSANGGSTTVTGAKVDIALKEGENWTCTYANHLIPKPGLSIVKKADVSTFTKVGDKISYTITATNTGNVTLHAVNVTDSTGLDGFSCTPTVPAASLAPGGTIVCTGTHTITQTDMDAGKYVNTACAKSTEADAGCDTVTVTTTQTPGLTVDKSSTTTVITAAGQIVPYSYIVTNTGNITLTGVTLTDDKVATLTCSPSQPATLAPGATMTCSGSHTVTAAEFAAGGNLTNIATADSDQTGPTTDTVSIPIAPPTVVAQITPTATTCQQFSSGTAATLDTLQYSTKGNPPKISQVSPGVFFYWVKVSGGGTYTITQSSTPTFKTFNIASGSAVWDANCNKVGTSSITQAANGTVTVTFTGSGTFYIGLKYDSGSVVGQPQPSPTTVHYTFSTTGVAGSTQGLDLKKKGT